MKSLTKKKVALLGVGAALCLATAATFGTMSIDKAFAEPKTLQPGSTTANVEITYSVDDAWTVTIPESITVGGEAVEVKAENVNIASGKELNVTLKGSNESEWKLIGSGDPITYTVKKGDNGSQTETVNPKDSILTVTDAQTSGSVYIKVETENTKSTGGEAYTDTLTFTVSVDDAE